MLLLNVIWHIRLLISIYILVYSLCECPDRSGFQLVGFEWIENNFVNREKNVLFYLEEMSQYKFDINRFVKKLKIGYERKRIARIYEKDLLQTYLCQLRKIIDFGNGKYQDIVLKKENLNLEDQGCERNLLNKVGVTMDVPSLYFMEKRYVESQFKRYRLKSKETEICDIEGKMDFNVRNSTENSISEESYVPLWKMKVEKKFSCYSDSLRQLISRNSKKCLSKGLCRYEIDKLLEEIYRNEKYLIGRIMKKLREIRLKYVDKITSILLSNNVDNNVKNDNKCRYVLYNDFFLGDYSQRYHVESQENYFSMKDDFVYVSKVDLLPDLSGSYLKKDEDFNSESGINENIIENFKEQDVSIELLNESISKVFQNEMIMDDIMNEVIVTGLSENKIDISNELLLNEPMLKTFEDEMKMDYVINEVIVNDHFENNANRYDVSDVMETNCVEDKKSELISEGVKEVNYGNVKDDFVKIRPCDELCVSDQVTDCWGHGLYNALLNLTKFTAEDDSFLDSWRQIMLFESCRYCFQDENGKEIFEENKLFCRKKFDCSDTFKHLILLQVHSSKIRTLLRRLYELRQLCYSFIYLKHAKEMGNYKVLCKMSLSFKDGHKKDLNNVGKIRVSEIEVREKHKKFLERFEKDIFAYCNRFCDICNMWFFCKDDNGNVKSVDEFLNGRILYKSMEIFEIVKRKYGRSYFFICTNCQKCLKNNSLPPCAEMNNMNFGELPTFMQKMNLMEWILCKIAKPFHTVIRLNPLTSPVGMPNRISAIKGTTVHFPMPVNETHMYLKETLPNVGGLDILVDNIPIKSSIAWRSLVRLKTNVYPAIQWLKENNRLYKDIEIDKCFENMNSNVLHVTTEECTNEVNESNQSLLRKWNHSEMNNVTIRNIDHIKPNNEDYELYRMQKITNTKPLYYSDKDLGHKCFPELFPLACGDMFDERNTKLPPSKYLRAIFNNRDDRFRNNKSFLFFCVSRYQERQLNQGMYSMIHTKRGFDIKKQDLINCDQKKLDNIEANLTTFASKIRGSKEYFRGLNSDLLAFDREFGPATFFVTLSVAEYFWPDVKEFLEVINVNSLKGEEKYTANNSNANIICNQFRRRWNAFIKHVLKNPKGPLGKVNHYFCRIEYQARGAPHIHMKVWIDGAPVLEALEIHTHESQKEFLNRINEQNKRIADFVDKYITCCLPDVKESPELFSLVDKFQRHNCSNSCYRSSRKQKGNGIAKKCRYGFPRSVNLKTVVESDNELLQKRLKSGRNSKLYKLERCYSEMNINDYNPAIMLAWKANMDIQYIGEYSQILNGYITSYITKSEKNNLAELWTGVAKSDSLRKNLASFGRQMLHSREVGEYEAFDLVLGNPYHYNSDHVIFVSTTNKENRKRRLKNYSEIVNMEDDNEKVYFNNMYDDYYPCRSPDLENMCLFDICSNFIFKKKKPKNLRGCFEVVNFGWFQPCKKKIIKTSYYNITTTTGEEDYYRSLLMLFRPWRNECELLGVHKCYKDAFEDCCFVFPEMLEYDRKWKNLFNSRKKAEYVKEEMNNVSNIKINDNDLKMESKDLMVEKFEVTFFADTEFDFSLKKIVDSVELEKKEKILNENQRAIYCNVIKKILPNEDNNFVPIGENFIISGVAGTGKSFLIDIIADKVRYELKDTESVAILGPTGVAAFNVKGSTIHSFFKLPVQKGKEGQLFALPEDDIQKLRHVWKRLKVIIIDEFSMVSNVTLIKIHLRLLQVLGDNGNYLPFSGINILLFGDLLQLAPVNAEYIFETVSSKAALHGLGVPGPVENFYKEFVYFELEMNMRQSGDLMYADMLNRIRTGSANSFDIEELKARIIKKSKNNILENSVDYFVEIMKTDSTVVALLPKNEDVENFNNLVTLKRDYNILNIFATDNVPSVKKVSKKMTNIISNMKMSDTGGLSVCLNVGIGTRIMLRRNLNVKIGLVNGTLGNVIRFNSVGESKDCVKQIIVKFDHLKEEIVIDPVVVEFKIGGDHFVQRKQFPLTVAYGITIHKCQGLTLNNILIDLGTNCFADSMAYVALSRVKCLSNIHLIELDINRLMCTTIAMKEYNRLRSSIGLKCIDQYNVLRNSKIVLGKELLVTSKDVKKNKKMVNVLKKEFLRLENPKCYCYCNSLIQCVVQLGEIIDCLRYVNNVVANTVAELFDCYIEIENGKSENMASFSTKIIIDNVWKEIGQQDVHHFWICMLNVMPQNFVKNFEFSILERTSCPSYKCAGKIVEKVIQYHNTMILTWNNTKVDNNNINCKFEDFFKVDYSREQICSNCNQNHLLNVKETIVWENEQKYFVVLLPLFDPETRTKVNRKIKKFNSNLCRIQGKQLKLICCIQHINSSNINSGHYVAWIRKNELWYVLSDDSEPKMHYRFVANFENMYMLFFKIL